MPRSGTNYLMDLLKCHPDITPSPNEIWEFPHFRNSDLLMQYVEGIQKSPHAKSFEPDRLLRHMGDAWISYFRDFAKDTSHIALKEPSVEHLASLFAVFPNARVLLIVRDGRDLVTSALASGFVAPPPFSIRNRHLWRRLIQPSDFTLLCRRYAAAARAIVTFEESEIADLHRSQFRRVCYEDILANTEEEVQGILACADLDPETYEWERMRNMPVRGSSFLRDADGKMNFGSGVERTPEFSPVGRWRSWTARQHRIFEREAGDAMRLLGYTLGDSDG